MPLKTRIRNERGIAIIDILGDVTEDFGRNLPGLDSLLTAGTTQIIVNLREVHYVNSAGLSGFVDAFKLVAAHHATLVLCELQPAVLKVVKLARVEIFIPVLATEAAAMAHFGQQAATPGAGGREQILVVEPGVTLGDEIQRLLTSQHESVNYRLSHASGVDEAIRFLSVRPTQVVIVDATMPIKETERLLTEMKQDPRFHNIAIVVAGPDDQISQADLLIRNGADDMLRLPLNAYEVSSRLRMAFTLHYALTKEDESLSKFAPARVAPTLR